MKKRKQLLVRITGLETYLKIYMKIVDTLDERLARIEKQLSEGTKKEENKPLRKAKPTELRKAKSTAKPTLASLQ